MLAVPGLLRCSLLTRWRGLSFQRSGTVQEWQLWQNVSLKMQFGILTMTTKKISLNLKCFFDTKQVHLYCFQCLSNRFQQCRICWDDNKDVWEMLANYKNSVVDEHPLAFCHFHSSPAGLGWKKIFSEFSMKIRMFLCFADDRVSESNGTFGINDPRFVLSLKDVMTISIVPMTLRTLRDRV